MGGYTCLFWDKCHETPSSEEGRGEEWGTLAPLDGNSKGTKGRNDDLREVLSCFIFGKRYVPRVGNGIVLLCPMGGLH